MWLSPLKVVCTSFHSFAELLLICSPPILKFMKVKFDGSVIHSAKMGLAGSISSDDALLAFIIDYRLERVMQYVPDWVGGCRVSNIYGVEGDSMVLPSRK